MFFVYSRDAVELSLFLLRHAALHTAKYSDITLIAYFDLWSMYYSFCRNTKYLQWNLVTKYPIIIYLLLKWITRIRQHCEWFIAAAGTFIRITFTFYIQRLLYGIEINTSIFINRGMVIVCLNNKLICCSFQPVCVYL